MALLTFNPHQARAVTAIAERLFPADESSAGAAAIGVLPYIDQALAGAYADAAETYRLGLAALKTAKSLLRKSHSVGSMLSLQLVG